MPPTTILSFALSFTLPCPRATFDGKHPPPRHLKMSASTQSLAAFLRLPRPQSPPHIVLTNEASDLDSVASALAYSYLANTTPPSLPIINIPSSHLHLRRDILRALSLANLTPQHLTFIDCLPQTPATVTLVDHNTLASHQAHLAPLVTAIIDHHADEHVFPHAQPRLIAPVGSCATLVSELGQPDLDTARLLVCAILIDCNNMQLGGKATPRDVQAIDRLSTIARWDLQQRTSVYTRLKAARNDITGFSVRDLLNKDMKIVQAAARRVAVCTVALNAWHLATRGEPLAPIINNFCAELGVDCVIVMNSYGSSDGHRRQICVLANQLGEGIMNRLLREEVLELSEINVDGAEGLLCFQQRNTKASRKVVAPILKRVLAKLGSEQR